MQRINYSPKLLRPHERGTGPESSGAPRILQLWGKNKPTVNHDITVILEARARPRPVITRILSNCILGNRRKLQTEGGVDEGEFESFQFVP